MREIKFRGKRLDNGKWVFGSLVTDNVLRAWIDIEDGMVEIDMNTVGQFTGIVDIEGNDICEGDIIVDAEFEVLPRLVFWHKEYTRFSCTSTRGIGYLALSDYDAPKVIGNIYDNPELLK